MLRRTFHVIMSHITNFLKKSCETFGAFPRASELVIIRLLFLMYMHGIFSRYPMAVYRTVPYLQDTFRTRSLASKS